MYLDPSPVLKVHQGEDAVVVCRTDDGGLYWMVTGEPNTLYNDSSRIKMTEQRGIFTVRLDSKNGSIFVSTAVARSVKLMNNGSSITCTDYSLANSRKVTLIVLGISKHSYIATASSSSLSTTTIITGNISASIPW